MQWLAQNWMWIFFAIGFLLLMRRGGMGRHGHAHGNRRHDGHDRSDGRAKDPVSGEEVNHESAVNVMYQGRVYYFASRENREKFEASPAQYAASAAAHPHRRHGC